MKAMIQNNTYAFYDKIGSTLEARFSKSQEISWLNTGNGFWPNMIYNTSVLEENVDDFIAKHTANIKSKIAPPFWLVEDDLIDKILAKKLNQKGLRHIMRWTGMGYKADNPLDIKLSSNTIIKTVNNVSELNAWKQILNTALMTSNKIHENIFEKRIRR